MSHPVRCRMPVALACDNIRFPEPRQGRSLMPRTESVRIALTSDDLTSGNPLLSARAVNPTRQIGESALFRYVLAVAFAVIAIVLRYWLNPFLGEDNPYHTAWVAVVLSAWYCGLGPSIVATLVTLLGVWRWLLPPEVSLGTMDRATFWGMFGFVVLSALIVTLGESARRSKAQQELTAKALRESEARLHVALQDRTAEIEQKTAQIAEQARWIDLANDAIFVRTPNGKIAYWNQGAARLYGWSAQEAIGQSPQDLLHTVFPVPFSEIAQSDLWEGELVQNKRDGSHITVASRWATLRDSRGELVGWLEINTDITARQQAEDAARRLSGRILNLQDEERRRIARELHDSLGQYLTAAKMNLDILSASLKGQDETALVSDCAETIARCLSETRTLSHLLHPPLLDEAGLVSAARWYAEGLAARSGIEVNLDLPPDLPRLDRDVETALFRSLQEALTNVYRHSGSSKVQVTLQLDAEHVRMEIHDNGRGIPQNRMRRFSQDGVGTGVGLAGMRERIREVGGTLTLRSGPSGTSVIVAVPIAPPEESMAAAEEDETNSPPGTISVA